MLLGLLLLLTLGNADLYAEACRLLQEGQLAPGAEALRSLPPGDPYFRKAAHLLPVVELLQGAPEFTGPRAPGRAVAGPACADPAFAGRLELGVGSDGTFTAGLLGGEGPAAAYIPFVFGFPGPVSSRFTVSIDGQAHALPPRGRINGASAAWNIDGVELTLALAPAAAPPAGGAAATLEMVVRNTSGRPRRAGVRLLLDLAEGFDDGPPLRAGPWGAIARSEEWDEEDLPPFASSGAVVVTLRGDGLSPPDRMMACPWLLAEDSLWEFPLQPGQALGPDSALVLFWSPRELEPNETLRAACRIGREENSLDRSGGVATHAVIEPGAGEGMSLVLYVENSAPSVLDTIEDIAVSVALPAGVAFAPGETAGRAIGALLRGQGRQARWGLTRTGETGGRQAVVIDVAGKGLPSKRITAAADLPASLDLAGRTLSPGGAPLPSSEVAAFAPGRPVYSGASDGGGSYRLRGVPAGSYELQGKKLLDRKPAVKRGHEDLDGAIFELTLDSDTIENGGAVTRARSAAGEGRDLALAHATFRYNLLISVEWDADRAFLDNVARGMRAASNYLYDATDGQMCFGKISVFDNGVRWNDADMQVFTQNNVHANANVGGYHWRWEPHSPWNPAIHFGRSWNGGGWAWVDGIYPWDDQSMYRTIVHEFGHYGLGLYDEYIGQIDGVWRGLSIPEMCPSFMGYQYVIGGDFNSNRDSELCYRANHHAYTAQGIYNGMSCWEWLKHTHDGVYAGVPVALVSPEERGCICSGPVVDVGNELQVFLHDADTGAFDASLCIKGPWPAETWNIPVWTTMAGDGRKLFQGSTGMNRRIRMLGVHAGDEVEAIHQGKTARMTLNGRRAEYELQFLPYPAAAADYPVLISVLPESTGTAPVGALTVEIETPLGVQGAPSAVVRTGSAAQPLALSAAAEDGTRWCGTLAFDAAAGGRGAIEVRLTTPAGERLDLVADFCLGLLAVRGDGSGGAPAAELYNADGTLLLRAAGALVGKEPAALVFASALVPPFDAGDAVLAGRIESIQGKGGPPRFEPPATLRLVIPPEAAGDVERLTLRRWDGSDWKTVTSELDSAGTGLVAAIDTGGLFALFAAVE